jgi:DNA-binding CsgD family transcriptional regulator
MVRVLMPALQQAWHIGQEFAFGCLERLLLEKSGGPDPAICLVRPDRTLAFHNARAAAMLEEGGLVRCDGRGRLRLEAAQPHRMMDYMLRNILTGPVHASCLLGHGLDQTRLRMISFNPEEVPDWDLGLFLGLRSPSLLLSLCQVRGAADRRECLVSSYGLSPAQADIALHLAAGYSVREIAARRRTAFDTVRKQIRDIAGRMGVSRQVEIVTRVISLAPGRP